MLASAFDAGWFRSQQELRRPETGLPPLPDLEFAVYEKARPDKAAAALAAVLLTLDRDYRARRSEILLTAAPKGREVPFRVKRQLRGRL
jgi:hypothetical protein